MADITITDQNFEEEVLKSDVPVLLDFWAPWCGPCKMVGPILEELSKDKEYMGKIKIAKLNVDENPQTAGRFNVMSIPTMMFFKKGNPVNSIVGAQGKESIKHAINGVLTN